MASYEGRVGRGKTITKDDILEAATKFQQAQVDPLYLTEQAKAASLPWDGLVEDVITKKIIDIWLSDPSNIVRAEKAVRRSVKAKFQNFSVIRTNALYRPVKTSAGPNPGITVVILAVKDFSLEGVKMEDGEDLIVDATEMIKFPMKGGALAIMFELEL